MQIRLKRAYEKPGRQDGQRILVDRLWPRGVRKEDLALDEWLRDIAPSTELRKWFHRDPSQWQEFERRYVAELDRNGAAVEKLLERVRSGRVTLVYGARDERRNHAVVLKRYIESRLDT